jgi:hypothetical protein
MLAKGREGHGARKGINHPCAKLTEAQVMEIRALAAQGMFQYEIGKRFNIHQSRVNAIVRRKIWKHVP